MFVCVSLLVGRTIINKLAIEEAGTNPALCCEWPRPEAKQLGSSFYFLLSEGLRVPTPGKVVLSTVDLPIQNKTDVQPALVLFSSILSFAFWFVVVVFDVPICKMST